VIGEVHEQTRPALRILADEGFECCDQVDIFEAGPVVRCALEDVRAIRESRKGTLAQPAAAGPVDSEEYVISNCREPFRAAKGKLDIDQTGAVILPPELAAALALQPGDPVRYVIVRPTQKAAARYHDANISFD
jgi:arginine N-succinyltransferase